MSLITYKHIIKFSCKLKEIIVKLRNVRKNIREALHNNFNLKVLKKVVQ